MPGEPQDGRPGLDFSCATNSEMVRAGTEG